MDKCHAEIYAHILDLYRTYENNDYAIERLNYYIFDLIPKNIESDVFKREEKIKKNIEITEGQENFFKLFLHSNPYYYLPNTNTFFYYTNNYYNVVDEDELHYTLLLKIGSDDNISQYKQKIKHNLLKRIKERHLFDSIPNSSTIQNILFFLQHILFETKDESKYFLTILGDRLLKKDMDYTYFIDNKIKHVISILDSRQPSKLQYSSPNFITKYHELHDINKYRILFSNSSKLLDSDINELKNISNNLMCVAVHYSKRYKSSELFLEDCNNKLDKILYFNNHTHDDLIDNFLGSTIENDMSFSISWKNMHYLWKNFLILNKLPSIFYAQNLKNKLIKRLNYDNVKDRYENITSKYLPKVSSFIKFWYDNIIIDSDGVCNEYEISELITILKKNKINLSESDLLNIIQHFFPEVNIVDDRYVLGIRCSLWDKQTPINNSIIQYYNQNSNSINDENLISFDELYNIYLLSIERSLACSKDYFYKYIKNKFLENIHMDFFIRGRIQFVNETT